MPEKSPETYNMLTYAWVVFISLWGGSVNYLTRVKANKEVAFSVAEWLGEICISAFAGVLTFWLCEYSNFDPLLTAALVGLSGHMGGKTIFVIETFFLKKIQVKDNG